jgi:hypothetical protein
MGVSAGAIHAFYLFDVAESIDLASVRRLIGDAATVATLHDKAPGPPRVRYVQPPIVAPGDAVGLGEVRGLPARLKFFDYGVISIMLVQPFTGPWADLVRIGQELLENESLIERASEACRQVVDRVRPALAGVRASFLREDYLAFVVSGVDDPGGPPSAETLLDAHGADIAQMLRGERQPLSRQEREEILRHRLSYLADDLVVPAFKAAFVFDSAPAAGATLEVLEFVNAQLLEFRYHDELLESELSRSYAALQAPRVMDRFVGRRSTRAARRLQALYIDVNELTDRLENAVKLVGDHYAARLFGLAAARLGLDAWKRNVEEKLRTLNDIYRFAVEQTGMSQGNLLELVIVLILILEFAMLLN